MSRSMQWPRLGAIGATATLVVAIAGCSLVMREPTDAVSMTIDEEGTFSWVFCDALVAQEAYVRYAPKDQITYDFEEIWRIKTRQQLYGGPLVFGVAPDGWTTVNPPVPTAPEGNFITVKLSQLDASGGLADAMFGAFDGDQLVVGEWLGADGQLRSSPCD